MENAKAEDTHEDNPDLHMVQLQALWAELKAGLRGVVQEISNLQRSNSRLEEQVSEYRRDAAEKILSLKNTLNTVQEDTGTTRSQMSDLGVRLKELQSDMDEVRRCQRREFSGGEELVDGFSRTCSRTRLSLTQHYVSSPSAEQDASAFRNHSRSPLWKERRNSRDVTEHGNQEMSQRQVSALELLESERVYVSYLSLLLKANISFNGSENSNLRDKRLFPSSLRFLIQQHLELLHLLQERVLRSPWQGIMGDVFLRLTSKESDFLENYVSYLKELPECLSVVGLFSNSWKLVGLIEDDPSRDETRPSLRTLLLRPVQRVPEYLMSLQNLLQHTESEHPDSYLLLVCVHHLRSFTSQYGDLFQLNQELLSHTHGRSSLKQLYKADYESSSNYSNSSTRSDPVHGARRAQKAAAHRHPEWEPEPTLFTDISFNSDSESRRWAGRLAQRRILEFAPNDSALAAFMPHPDADSHDSSPSHSSDSSIDIAYGPAGITATVPRPLQPAQRKSKSLNGLQEDCTDARCLTSPAHQMWVRQSSARERPTRHHETLAAPPQCPHEVRDDPPNSTFLWNGKAEKDHLFQTQESPLWEEPKWKSEVDHAPPSEHGRKEGKGFRSSFKKLFRKK